jgi:hypothetical protein
MDIQKTDTAVVFIDPQNDVLSEKGANWGAVGASVTENRTVDNMERIFEAAKRSGYDVFISPPIQSTVCGLGWKHYSRQTPLRDVASVLNGRARLARVRPCRTDAASFMVARARGRARRRA